LRLTLHPLRFGSARVQSSFALRTVRKGSELPLRQET